MAKKADGMKNTFKEFFNGFSNLDDIKESLCNATAVMITGVHQNLDLSDVVQRYKGTSFNMGDIAPFYRYLKKSLIEKERIFIFKAAELGKKCDVNNDILKKLEENTEFWEIDMKYIKISISQYALEEEFDQERAELARYYKQTILKDLQIFTKVLNKLSEDNINLNADRQGGQQKFLDQLIDYTENNLLNREITCQKGKVQVEDKQKD